MNATEALEYLGRIAEADADIDPGIREAVTVLSETLECFRQELEGTHTAIRYLVHALLDEEDTDEISGG